jgi:hypothetical protein
VVELFCMDPAAVVILFCSLNNSVSWTINSDHRICSLAAANELICSHSIKR